MQTPIIFIEISVRSQGSIVSANPTKSYRNETIQLSIGEKKIRSKAPFRVFIIFIPSIPSFATLPIAFSYFEHTIKSPSRKANPAAKSFPIHEIKKFVRNKSSFSQITYTSQKFHLLQNPRQSLFNIKKPRESLPTAIFSSPYIQPTTESTPADCFAS